VSQAVKECEAIRNKISLHDPVSSLGCTSFAVFMPTAGNIGNDPVSSLGGTSFAVFMPTAGNIGNPSSGLWGLRTEFGVESEKKERKSVTKIFGHYFCWLRIVGFK
jgi:hypothetical protein